MNAATICGANESGKSTLIKAILFALFGKTGQELEKLIYDLADETSVTMTFSHNGEVYKVQRGVKRGKSQTIKLWCGEKDISERLASNTQQKLEDILKFSFTLLLSTAVARQDEINRLSIMTPSEREKVLSEMLSLEVWEQKKKKVAEILNENKNIQQEISDLELQLATALGEISTNEENFQKISDTIVAPQIERDRLVEELKGFDELIKKQDEYNKLNLQKTSIKASLDAKQAQLSAIPVDPEIDLRIDAYKQIKAETYALKKHKEDFIKEQEKELKAVQGTLTEARAYAASLPATKILDKVPCAGMEIHSRCELLSNAFKSRDSIKAFLDKHEMTDLPQFITALQEICTETESTIKSARKDWEKINFDLTNILTSLAEEMGKKKQLTGATQLEEEIKKLAQQFTELSEKLTEVPNVDRVAYQQKTQRVKELEASYNRITQQLAVLENDQQHLIKTKDKLVEELTKLKEIDAHLANYRTLHSAYNDIPTLLFEQAIPTLEEYTNEILEKVSPGKRVQLRSFRETKSNTQQKALDVVSTMATGIRDFDDLSGSAKFRQSLALRIALSRYNREMNNIDLPIFVIDEGFGSLDGDNQETIKIMLKEIASCFDLFLMVSHIPELQDVLPHQIMVNSSGRGEKVILKGGAVHA